MSDTVTNEVRSLLQTIADTYGAKDADALAGYVIDDCILVGTGVDEVRFGPDGFRA